MEGGYAAEAMERAVRGRRDGQFPLQTGRQLIRGNGPQVRTRLSDLALRRGGGEMKL